MSDVVVRTAISRNGANQTRRVLTGVGLGRYRPVMTKPSRMPQGNPDAPRHEGLPNNFVRVGPKPRKIGGGRSGGTRGYAG